MVTARPRRHRLTAFAEQIGFEVEEESGVVRAVRVPCLFVDGVLGTCTVETSYDPATGRPDNRIGGAVHAVKVTIDGEYNGRVYHADGTPIGNHVGGDGKTWSNISIKRGAPSRPEPDETAHDLLHRYAKHLVGAVSAAGYSEPAALAMPDPFHIPNTFEARAAIAPVQDRIRGQRVAIIGLGGTGAYLLDLIAKTPVSEIHLLDSDYVEWHTFKRAPGAPTAEEIELVRTGSLLKVDYYHSKYSAFRDGIYPHPCRVDSPASLVVNTLPRSARYEISLSLAKSLAPHVDEQSMRAGTVEYRIIRHLMDRATVLRLVGPEKAREWYDQMREYYHWNGRYWDQRALLESGFGAHETARSYAERSIQVHNHSFGYNTLGTVLLRMAINRGNAESLIDGIKNLERARGFQNWGEREHPFVTFFTSLLRFSENWGINAIPQQARAAWTQWFRDANSATLFSRPEQRVQLEQWNSRWLNLAVGG